MHKTLNFLKNNEEINIEKKNIIFLDIDGVLQPYSNQYRFKHDMNATIDYLCKKYNDDIYKKLDKYDVCAAYYDWDEISIGILKWILNKCEAYIVIHSGWKEFMTLEGLKAIFRFYDLEDYVIDVCEKGDKTRVIKEYLSKHEKEINEYVVVDDLNMVNDFGYNFVKTKNVITLDNCNQIAKVLHHVYAFDFEDNNMFCYRDGKKILKLEYLMDKIEDKKFFIIKFKEIDTFIHNVEYMILLNEFIKFITNNFIDVVGISFTFKKQNEIFKLLPKDNYFKHEYKEGFNFYYINTDDSTFSGFKFYNQNRGAIISTTTQKNAEF